MLCLHQLVYLFGDKIWKKRLILVLRCKPDIHRLIPPCRESWKFQELGPCVGMHATDLWCQFRHRLYSWSYNVFSMNYQFWPDIIGQLSVHSLSSLNFRLPTVISNSTELVGSSWSKTFDKINTFPNGLTRVQGVTSQPSEGWCACDALYEKGCERWRHLVTVSYLWEVTPPRPGFIPFRFVKYS